MCRNTNGIYLAMEASRLRVQELQPCFPSVTGVPGSVVGIGASNGNWSIMLTVGSEEIEGKRKRETTASRKTQKTQVAVSKGRRRNVAMQDMMRVREFFEL